MDDASFRGDCGRCVGLCCVALAFDRGPLFAIDKPAGQACPNLGPDCRCTIHAQRAAQGFAGCALYDCFGAGQLTTSLFSSLDWRDSDAARRQMLRAFALLRDIQQLRIGLRRLGRLDLLSPLEPEGGWTLASLLLDAPSALAAARPHLAKPAAAATGRARIGLSGT